MRQHTAQKNLFEATEDRDPDLARAVLDLASNNDELERGAVFTKHCVVEAILNLVGYTPDQPLHSRRLLEPACGAGDFLLPAVDRLLVAYTASGGSPSSAPRDLSKSICAIEIHRGTYEKTLQDVAAKLVHWGLKLHQASKLAGGWMINDDFLLLPFPDDFHTVVGNPPYVRQERIPTALIEEYRRRYKTIYDRADLYVPFYERALDLLTDCGTLGFICANRWLKNKYGGPLREKVAKSFHLQFYIDMSGTDAFHSEVFAYPCITVIRPQSSLEAHRITRVASKPDVTPDCMKQITESLLETGPDTNGRVTEIRDVAQRRDPWLLDHPSELALLRKLESRFPTIEEAKCQVGIGVATGADRVFIGQFADLDVEEARKLPLVMAADLKAGGIEWGGSGVINPFADDGRLAPLPDFPRFHAYLEKNRAAIERRHVAKKNPNNWYRTIDRIYPDLQAQPKLLIPDIKGTATIAYDEGRFYPHHNLYHVTSKEWDLRALQTLLRSSVAIMFVSTYCVRMAGGFLRFQAQYLRRIHLPDWQHVSKNLRRQLVRAANSEDQTRIDTLAFKAYGLTSEECEQITAVAEKARVKPKQPEKANRP